MDGWRGKVVCHLHKGDDLKKEVKQRVLNRVLNMTKSRELSLEGHHSGKYVGRRNHYCI